MGVCPTGLQVLRTEGIKRKPDSSIKTRWAASLAAFFLHGAKRIVSIRRLPPHRAPRPYVLAFDGSSLSGAGVCPRDCDGISLPIDVRSDQQFAGWSTTLSGIRGPWPLGLGDEQVVFSVSRSVEVAGPVLAWLSMPLAHRSAR